MAEFKLTGKQMIQKTVGRHGNGAVVYCPKEWIGKQVAIILEGK
jgi:putative transposon-encoded protein